MEPLPPPSDGDQNRGPLCIQVDAVLTSVAIVTTLLRLTTRLCTRHQGWDDFAIAWGLVRELKESRLCSLAILY